MIQYRLIKVYPGSPKLGTIHSEEHHLFRGAEYYDAFLEFWKKVEELDYEILSFKNNITEYVVELHSNGLYCCKESTTYNGIGTNSMEDCLNTKKLSIHSVKRLSDGEVFTIGDILKYKSFGIKKITIDRFDVLDRSVFAFGNNYGTKIIAAEKVKTPLFTTKDGVDIFEGDKFCLVQISTLTILEKGRYKPNMKDWICFSTKEKAEEYILLNKPCLCLNDLKTIWEGANFPIEVSVLFKRFKKLAKSKL